MDYVLLKNGQLALKYDIENLNAGVETLAVIWFNERNGVPNRFDFINLGGVVDEASKTITIPFVKDGFGFYGVYSVTHAFGDFNINNNQLNWLSNYASPVYSKGFISPVNVYADYLGILTQDGFEVPITQGEFASMLVKVLGLQVDSLRAMTGGVYNVFGIRNSYVEVAMKHGFLNGIPVGVNNMLTREEAAVMIARAMELNLYEHPDIIKRITNRVFSDGQYISDWMRPHVYAVYRARYIDVEKDKSQRGRFIFKPKEAFTRAQAVKTIYKIMKEREEKKGEVVEE